MVLSLDELAGLFNSNSAVFDEPVNHFAIGDREFDTDVEPIIMGVVNLSRDSTYRESVAPTQADAVRRARIMFEQGAHVIDIGAESSRADASRTSVQQQIDSVVPVIEELAKGGIATSIESYELEVLRAALEAGASVVNLTGTKDEEAIFETIGDFNASLVMCFTPGETVRDDIAVRVEKDPIPPLIEHFAPRIDRARNLGVGSIAIDPGLGFFYGSQVGPITKVKHQAQVLLHSFRLRELGVPVCQITPHAFDVFQEEFRTAEGVFAVLASLGRVGVLRVHEVARVRASLSMMETVGVHMGGAE
jgi:dihydropteroate synthase